MKKPVFKIKEILKSVHFIFTIPGETAEAYSESYTTKAMCEKGIESVKANAEDSNNYEMKVARNSQLYFLLRAKNGEVILKSKMHNSEASRDNGILLLKQFAKEAEVEVIPNEDQD